MDAVSNKTIRLFTSGARSSTDTEKITFTLGRDRSSNTVVLKHPSIGNRHAALSLDRTTRSFYLEAVNNTCWILDGRWTGVVPGSSCRVLPGQAFRLLAPSLQHCHQNQNNVQFSLGSTIQVGNQVLPGTGSFDQEYLKLLQKIDRDGVLQMNKKGSSKTLRDSHTLVVDLSCNDFHKNILPVTTLRKMYGGHMAIFEALWYIRGEEHIGFLQHHGCKFWDAQAQDGGFVGLSYGLLTNFPCGNTGYSTNQLLDKVILPLCKKESSSRNLVCLLSKPGEITVQEACTTSVQFAVAKGTNEYLDITINQRLAMSFLDCRMMSLSGRSFCTWSVAKFGYDRVASWPPVSSIFPFLPVERTSIPSTNAIT